MFDSTLELVGFPPDQAALPGDSGGYKPRDSKPASVGRPYATTEFKFGKYKGLTIEQIDDTVDDGGDTGHSYLQWFAKNGKDGDFMTKAVRGYLEG